MCRFVNLFSASLFSICITGFLPGQQPATKGSYHKVIAKQFDEKSYDYDSFAPNGIRQIGIDPNTKEITYILVKASGTLSRILPESDSLSIASEEAMDNAITSYGRAFAKNPATIVEKKTESLSRMISGKAVDANMISKGNTQNLQNGQLSTNQGKDETLEKDQGQSTTIEKSNLKSNSDARNNGKTNGNYTQTGLESIEESTRKIEGKKTTDWVYDSNFRSMQPVKQISDGKTLCVWYLVSPNYLANDPLEKNLNKNSKSFLNNDGFKPRESR